MKVSIITPSYNQEEFIERTIRSVLLQRGDFELEYIIIDGKSKDNSLAIIQKYAQRDRRIRYVSEKDKGQADAINKGFAMATGDIVAWLNSDDEYAPDAIQKAVLYFERHPKIGWLYGRCDIIDKEGRRILPFVTFYKYVTQRFYGYSKLLVENCVPQPATFFRRILLEKTGGLNEKLHLGLDYELWLRFAKESRAGVVNDTLAHFRRYDDSKSGAQFKKQFYEQYEIAKRFTDNKIILFLHWISIQRIIGGYVFFNFFAVKKSPKKKKQKRKRK